jgi:serine/threonine-protein kinase RIM15
MERTISEDFRVEREELKEAAEHSQNVILDLSLDRTIRFVSPSWQELIGTTPASVQGKPIADILVENKTAFDEGVESLQKDDSKSQIIRFSVTMGPLSALRRRSHRFKDGVNEGHLEPEDAPEEDTTLSLEAQGIMIYDRTSGGESHVSSSFLSHIIYTNRFVRPCG